MLLFPWSLEHIITIGRLVEPGRHKQGCKKPRSNNRARDEFTLSHTWYVQVPDHREKYSTKEGNSRLRSQIGQKVDDFELRKCHCVSSWHQSASPSQSWATYTDCDVFDWKWSLTICLPAFDKQVSGAYPAPSSPCCLSLNPFNPTAKPSNIVNNSLLSTTLDSYHPWLSPHCLSEDYLLFHNAHYTPF